METLTAALNALEEHKASLERAKQYQQVIDIALLSVIVLWSETHSAFGFLENITLWDVTSTVQDVESIEPITLGSVLIAILVLIITTAGT